MVLPWSVTIPPSTGNLSILWAVDGTAWIFLRPGLPMMPLYGDEDLTIMKFIKALVECSSSPRDTINEICLNGQDIYPLNPKSGAVAGITIGLSCPSLLVRGGKEISWLAEKLWVTLCLVIRCQGMGGGALNFTVSIAKISFGVFVKGVNLSYILPDLC
ncbi:hypothetical protein Tco_0651432 [Tanacetum coccineum]|uniref:Uncharacterized protein n=1 Tax=Tanacetum coccineum TaxID=301880 RepID=A0ABQ4WV27_9ASTR